MEYRRVTLIVPVLCGLLIATPAAAQRFSPGEGGGGSYQNQRESGRESTGLGRAVSRLRKSTGGRVLSAETEEQEAGPVHYIRILTREGKVRRFRVDGESGRRLPPRGKRQ
ncbi:MAG: hypothetical protein ABW148_10510 [Sedimenticola sp.]